MDAVSRQTWANVPLKNYMAAVGGRDVADVDLREIVMDARLGASDGR